MAPVPNSRFQVGALPGAEVKTFANGEMCILPSHAFSPASEKDLEAEQMLCAIDLYNQADDLSVSSKVNSTSIGLLVQRPKEGKPTDFKTIAKWKPTGQQTSVKTSANLAYYHLSRYLDLSIDVNVAVLRTVDADALKPFIEEGLKKAPRSGNQRNLKGWKDFDALSKGENPMNLRADVLTSDGKQFFGSFYANPSNTETDSAYGHAKGLAGAPGWQSVTKPGAITLSTPQAAYSAIDASEMIVLDVLLAQQDRIGNVDKKEKELDDGTKVWRMVLSDNDGGLRGNKLQPYLKNLRHMRQKTYDAVQKFAKEWGAPDSELKAFFSKECALSPAEVKKMDGNITFVATTLKALKDKNQLRLDLEKPVVTGPTS
jgi:hypothetical protein